MKIHWREFFSSYESALYAWFIIIGSVLLGIHFGIDRRIIAAVVLLVGIIGNAFAIVLVWIGLVPVVGPLIVSVLTLPFIWILNGIGYLVSVVAIRRGYTKDVINYRMATVTLIVGIIIGYIVGRLI